eukprot:scaffold425_cov175-Amphora_coffeaeformis.AAC.47
MKLSASAFLVFLATAHGLEDRGCVDVVEPGMDLFTDKVEPLYSEFWDVQYFDTYKIVTNKQYDLTYLLYQCGTEVPADQVDAGHEAILEIPLQDVAITVTPMITYMEQLGLRDEISTFLSDASFVASPCFAADIESGKVTSLDRGDETVAPSLVGMSPPEDTNMLTTFISGYEQTVESARPPFANTVVAVSESSEQTNNAIFEWVKFFAVFFNQEKVANEVFDAAESRYQCVANNAASALTDSENKPKLLWAYYSPFCGGWDVGECPNYYCEYATACAAEIMVSSEGTNEAAKEKCGAIYMTDDEFFAHAKDADFWFFPSLDWVITEEMFGDRMMEIKAYREQKVYDYMGRGNNAWFEQRFAEFYVVVEDVCHTLGVKPSLTGRSFWRDVFTESIPPSGAEAECNEDAEGSILADVDTCIPIADDSRGDDASTAFATRSIILGLILTAGALFCA